MPSGERRLAPKTTYKLQVKLEGSSRFPSPTLGSKSTFASKVIALTPAVMPPIGPMDFSFCLLSRPQLLLTDFALISLSRF